MRKIYLLPIFIFLSCNDDNIFDSKLEELNFYQKKNASLKEVNDELEEENDKLKNEIASRNL